MTREITSQELAARFTARGVATSVGHARALLQRFAVERVVEPVAPDLWRLTDHGAEVTAGLRAVESELTGGAS